MSLNNTFNTCIKYSPAISALDKTRIIAIFNSFQHVNGDIEYEIQLEGEPTKIWANRRDLIGTRLLENYENERRRSRGGRIYYGSQKVVSKSSKRRKVDENRSRNASSSMSFNLSNFGTPTSNEHSPEICRSIYSDDIVLDDSSNGIEVIDITEESSECQIIPTMELLSKQKKSKNNDNSITHSCSSRNSFTDSAISSDSFENLDRYLDFPNENIFPQGFKRRKIKQSSKENEHTSLENSSLKIDILSNVPVKKIGELSEISAKDKDDIRDLKGESNNNKEKNEKVKLILQWMEKYCALTMSENLMAEEKTLVHASYSVRMMKEIIDKTFDKISNGTDSVSSLDSSLKAIEIFLEKKKKFVEEKISEYEKLIEKSKKEDSKHSISLSSIVIRKNVACKESQTDKISSNNFDEEFFDYKNDDQFFSKYFKYTFEYKKFDANTDKLIDHRIANKFVYKGNVLGGLIGSLARYITKDLDSIQDFKDTLDKYLEGLYESFRKRSLNVPRCDNNNGITLHNL